MKKLLAILLAAGMVLSLAACGSTPAAGTPAASSEAAPAAEAAETAEAPAAAAGERHLNIVFHDPTVSLSPYQGMGDAAAYLQCYGYEELFMKQLANSTVGGDGSQELLPVIAKSYEKVDPKTYEIEIYDYVHDSEGNPITADDVVFSFNKCMELGNLAVAVGGIESVEKIDDYHIRYVLNNTQAGAFENSITQVGIVSQKAYEEHDGFVTECVSTSPYKIQNFISGASMDFVKNEDYWQKDELRTIFSQTNVDSVHITFVTGEDTRALAVQTGDADFATRVPQSQLYLFEGNPDYTVFSVPNSLTYITSFNMGTSASGFESVFKDNELLRKAILTGIDQQAFVTSVAGGAGDVAHTYGNKFYPDYLDKWETEEYYDYDLDKAKEMLAEAGYGENELEIKILCTSSGIFASNAQVLQACLSKMGVKAELMPVDSSIFNDTRNSYEGWDMVVDNKGAGDFVSTVFKYSFDQDMYGGHTQCGYVDEDMQVLLRAALDAETHNADTVDAFHQYLKNTAISYGIYYDYYNYPATSKIKTCPFSDKSVFLFGAAEYDDSLFQ